MSYTLSTTMNRPYDETVKAVREALTEQGFGILTEIDLQATLREKLSVDIPPQVILGACRPPLAYAAIQAEPSVAALLPCNVVVRSVSDGDDTTIVEAMDPDVMTSLANNDKVNEVAKDAKERIEAALASLTS
jgi:uncharacterized protein (DUF302 family)